MRLKHLVLCVLAAWSTVSCKNGKVEQTGPPAAKQKGVEAAKPEQEESEPEPVHDDPPLGRTAIAADGSPEAKKVNIKGLALLEKRKLTKARAKFEEALEKDPEYAAAAYNLACVLSFQGEHAASADMIEKVLVGAYPRFGPSIEEDKDLLGLRLSKEWTRVQAMQQKYRVAWARALRAEGAYVLAPEKMALKSPSGMLLDEESTLRGRVYFHHLATGRFLPLGLGRNVAGFLLDARGKRLHAIRFSRMVEEMDVVPSQYAGITVATLDLENLTTEVAKVPRQATGLVLYVHEDRTILRLAWFEEAMANEYWIFAEVKGRKVERIKQIRAELTPIDMSDGEWTGGDTHSGARLGEEIPAERYLFLDVFCKPAFPDPSGSAVPDQVPGADGFIQVDVL